MAQGFTSALPLPLAISKGGTGGTTVNTALNNFGITATGANLSLLAGANSTLVQTAYNEYPSPATSTAIIPYDNTIPQITEGSLVMAANFTPKKTTNILIISVQAFITSNTTNAHPVMALFLNSTANAIHTIASPCTYAGGAGSTLNLRHIMTAGTTSLVTFTVRIGPTAAATLTMGGSASAGLFGGTAISHIMVQELST